LRILPRQLWRGFVQDVAVEGPPLDLASLHAITRHFAPGLKKLLKDHKGLHADTFKAPRAKGQWAEADPKGDPRRTAKAHRRSGAACRYYRFESDPA